MFQKQAGVSAVNPNKPPPQGAPCAPNTGKTIARTRKPNSAFQKHSFSLREKGSCKVNMDHLERPFSLREKARMRVVSECEGLKVV